MQYLFKNNKLYKYNENIIVESEFSANDQEFCIEENGYKLLSAMTCKDFKVDKGLVVVDGKAKLKTIESKLPNFDTNFTNSFIISVAKLNQSKDFADKRNLKPILTGVYVNSVGTIVATDSYKVFCINKGRSEDGVVLPMDFINELAKETKEATIKFNNTCVCIELEDRKVYGRLLNGKYPDVLGIIEKLKNNATKCDEVLASLVLNKVKVGKLVGGDIDISFSENGVEFKGDNEYTAENDTGINDITFKLGMIDLAFSNSYNPKVYYTSNTTPLLLSELDKEIIILPIKNK